MLTEGDVERIAQRIYQLLMGTTDDLVSTSDICRLTGRSRRTVYRKIEEGALPAPKKVGRELGGERSEVLKARLKGKI